MKKSEEVALHFFISLLNYRYHSSLHRLLDIFQQIFTCFETDAEADGGVWDGHLGALLGGEETEDGRGGMDGQRLAIEEVRGATDDLKFIDERPGGFLRFEVNGEDGTRQGTELCL